MKTKQIVLLGIATLIVVAVSLEWHIAGISEVESAPKRVAKPTQTIMPFVAKLTDRTSPNPNAETPEMKNARIMAEVKKATAKFTPMREGFKSGGLKGMLNAQMDQLEPEYLEYFKSLGFSDALSSKVFQLLKTKLNFARDHREEKLESLRRGELHEAHDDELHQLEVDFETAVGTENYDKINYWQNTRQDRKNSQTFKLELESQALHLTGEQEAAIVDAMYQARQGRSSFGLNLPFISMEAKLAYIENVKQSLSPILSGSEVNLLGHYLQGIAEKPLVPPALQPLLPENAKEQLLGPQNLQKVPQ